LSVGRPSLQHRDGRPEVGQPVGRFAAQVGGRGSRLPAGIPERHDRLQPATAAAVRPAHLSGVRVRLQRAHHGRRPVQRLRAGHRGQEAAVRGRPGLRLRGQLGRHGHRRVRFRAAHIAHGVAGPKLDIRTVPVLFPANAPGRVTIQI